MFGLDRPNSVGGTKYCIFERNTLSTDAHRLLLLLQKTASNRIIKDVQIGTQCVQQVSIE
jgi:hypothetical protein